MKTNHWWTAYCCYRTDRFHLSCITRKSIKILLNHRGNPLNVSKINVTEPSLFGCCMVDILLIFILCNESDMYRILVFIFSLLFMFLCWMFELQDLPPVYTNYSKITKTIFMFNVVIYHDWHLTHKTQSISLVQF